MNPHNRLDLQKYNQSNIEEFRANAGRLGGPFEGATMLLLTTVGAKTGLSRTNPLMYFADGNRYLIAASYAGGPNNPPWYYNLLATPIVEVEMGTERFQARAEILNEPERATLYARIASTYPMFAEYQRQTTRPIPVIALYRQQGTR